MKTFLKTSLASIFISTCAFGQWCVPSVVPYNANMPGITNVTFNSINRTSPDLESSSSNYVNTGLSTTVTRGSAYNFSMTFNVDAQICPEMNLRVWIDFNVDGQLDDPGETVLSADHQMPGTYTATITIPSAATLGNTRMRVTSKMTDNGGHTLPSPCNVPADPIGYHGGVEDYTINIVDASGINEVDNNFCSLSISPNPATEIVTLSYELNAAATIKAEVINMTGENVYTITELSNQLKGNHRISFNIKEAGLTDGIYFVMLTSGENRSARKLIIVK